MEQFRADLEGTLLLFLRLLLFLLIHPLSLAIALPDCVLFPIEKQWLVMLKFCVITNIMWLISHAHIIV